MPRPFVFLRQSQRRHSSAGDIQPHGRYFWEWWLLNDLQPVSPMDMLKWWGHQVSSLGQSSANLNFAHLSDAGLVDAVEGESPKSWRLPRLFKRRGPFCTDKTEKGESTRADNNATVWREKLRHTIDIKSTTQAGVKYSQFISSLTPHAEGMWNQICPAAGHPGDAAALERVVCAA